MNTMLATGDIPLSEGFLNWREMCRKKPGFDVGRLIARGNPQLSEAECAAYNAPFPDAGFRAALRAFPELVPDGPDAPGAALSRKAQAFLQAEWNGESFMAVGVQDPVLGPAEMARLQGQIRNVPEPMLLADAGHFVQEHGEVLARAVVDCWAGR
jgi:tRNA(adenine34) deaminase